MFPTVMTVSWTCQAPCHCLGETGAIIFVASTVFLGRPLAKCQKHPNSGRYIQARCLWISVQGRLSNCLFLCDSAAARLIPFSGLRWPLEVDNLVGRFIDVSAVPSLTSITPKRVGVVLGLKGSPCAFIRTSVPNKAGLELPNEA